MKITYTTTLAVLAAAVSVQGALLTTVDYTFDSNSAAGAITPGDTQWVSATDSSWVTVDGYAGDITNFIATTLNSADTTNGGAIVDTGAGNADSTLYSENTYFTFSLTALENMVSLDNLSVDVSGRFGFSPRFGVAVSTTGFTGFDADGTDVFVAEYAPGTNPTTWSETLTADLSAFSLNAGDVAEFRIYVASGGNANSDRKLNIDNISVGVIPEPTSVALLGLSGLALVTRRKR